MKCDRCKKEMRNTVGGCYVCDNCGFALDDCVYRQDLNDCRYRHNFNDYGFGFISIPNTEPKVYQQGWVCPKCGGVYSPSQGCCPNCTPAQPIKFTCGTGTASLTTEPPNNISISPTGWTSSALHPNCQYDVKYNVAPQPKRGRGRPRIHPVKTEKRPVGRPRKIVNK